MSTPTCKCGHAFGDHIGSCVQCPCEGYEVSTPTEEAKRPDVEGLRQTATEGKFSVGEADPHVLALCDYAGRLEAAGLGSLQKYIEVANERDAAISQVERLTAERDAATSRAEKAESRVALLEDM